MDLIGPLLAALGCGSVVALGAPPVLRRLPEPPSATDPEAPDAAAVAEEEPKLPYAALVRPPFLLGCGLAAALTGALGWALSAGASRPMWLVLATFAVLLAGIDARTTWLPLPLTRAAWSAMGLAAVGAGVWGGFDTLLRAAAGAALAGGLYWLVWSLSRGGFGFGDVRFAPLVGAPAAGESFTVLLWALVLGSLVGAGWGVVRLLRRRRSPFPYAPAILAGAYLALVASAAVRT